MFIWSRKTINTFSQLNSFIFFGLYKLGNHSVISKFILLIQILKINIP